MRMKEHYMREEWPVVRVARQIEADREAARQQKIERLIHEARSALNDLEDMLTERDMNELELQRQHAAAQAFEDENLF